MTYIHSRFIYTHVHNIGISYFVYGEKVDVYSGDPQLKEFMELGLKFIRSLADIAFALPLYKLHIHTKTYRDYVDTLNKLQDRGAFNNKNIINRCMFLHTNIIPV